jgi:hypothetical protein
MVLLEKEKNASRLKNGTLLVEMQNGTEVLLTANLLGSYPIQVERHTSLNYSRGVVNAESLDGMSDEEIQSALADQFVSKAYRLNGKRGDKSFLCALLFFYTIFTCIHPCWV